MVCDFLLFHSIFPTAEVRHPEQQRCIIIICKSENLGSGVMSCTEVFFLESFWSSQRSPTTNGFQKATWLFTWLYTVPCFTMLFVSLYSSTQVHHSSLLEVLLPLRLQALDTEFTYIEKKKQLKHACAWCLCHRNHLCQINQRKIYLGGCWKGLSSG